MSNETTSEELSSYRYSDLLALAIYLMVVTLALIGLVLSGATSPGGTLALFLGSWIPGIALTHFLVSRRGRAKRKS